jgi:MFS family permease
MKVNQFDQWQIVSYVQIIWFTALAIVNIVLISMFHNKVQNRKQLWMFSGYFGGFTLAKMLGGILGLVFLHKSEYDQGLYIAVYVFDSVSLGVLLKSAFPFVKCMLKKDVKNDEEMYTKPSKWPEMNGAPKLIAKYLLGPLEVLTLFVLIAIILSIVGSSQMASGGSLTENKVSSLMFLAATLVLAAIVIYVNFNNPHYVLPARLLLAVSGLLVIRCLYAIVAVFHNLSFTNPSKYSLMFGDYKYFTFLSLMMECVIGVILLFTYRWFLVSGRFN